MVLGLWWLWFRLVCVGDCWLVGDVLAILAGVWVVRLGWSCVVGVIWLGCWFVWILVIWFGS